MNWKFANLAGRRHAGRSFHRSGTCGAPPGFTLVELLVVIAVIAILASLLLQR